MSRNHALRRIIVVLPEKLIEYADQRAKELSTSRSEIISNALSTICASETEELAADGYRYYSAEASEFARAPAPAKTWDEIWLHS